MSVSVVIPSYNRARRLPGAIDSAFRQEIPGLEVIVVDDGSEDDTASVIAAYGDRVRGVHQANAGVGAARNTGIRQATRPFIAFLDSDDRWREGKLAEQLALFAARPDVGLVFSDFVIEAPDGSLRQRGADLWAGRVLDFPDMERVHIEAGPVPGVTPEMARSECWAGPMYRQLLNELPILTSSVVVRRDVLDATTWFAERVVLFEDWEFFARVARRASVAFTRTATTVNVGHRDPGRVSKCSSLDRAEAYRSLLARVWLSDEAFMRKHGDAARQALGRALLAVAREALLSGHRDRARAALDGWRAAEVTGPRSWAAVMGFCERVAGGDRLLRNLLRGRQAFRLLTGHVSGDSVNPAA